jgi:cobalt-zinc-cadmium efflux system protein
VVHAHKRRSDGNNRKRLAIVLVLTSVYMIAEVVGGFLTNSLALLSDAGHMVTDIAALALAMFALWFASRPVTHRKTYGYYRMEILAALVNGTALAVIALLISIEAVQRFSSPKPVDGREVMFIALGGLIVNIVSAWMLHSASEENLNMRGAFLHVLSDALGSVGAIIAGLTVWLFGWVIADPLMSILMCLLIVYSSWQLIRESVNVLLEGTPSHINVKAVIEAMEETKGVVSVHDLHIWTISSGKEALSAHVTITAGASHRETLDLLQRQLRARFNIGHVTIQLESLDSADPETVKLYQIMRRGDS